MRILLVSQYFSPEVTAAPLRLHPMARGLAERGHEVEVACEIPSHPQGRVHPGYGRSLVKREQVDGFRVTHVRTHVSPSKHPLHRLGSYATFAAMATAVASAGRRPDVVFASSPPLSVGVVGATLAKRFRVPWVLDVRDLWPEIALALEQVGESPALRLASAVERRLYRSAAAVTTVTEPFVEAVSARRGSPGVHLLPNGTSREWLAAAEQSPRREELGLPADGFLLTYAGNVGLSQNLDTAIEAIRAAGPRFRMLIVGDGASRARLEAAAAEMAPGRVVFRDPVPPHEAARYLRASDALLVSLADRPALGKTIPIQLYDYCAVGRPVIVAAPGEAGRIARESEIGLVAAPGDAADLVTALAELAENPDIGVQMTARAREFAGRHLREDLVDDLERILADVVRG
jgi:glycosyltransferase involved in cell wall biosynthesis